MSIYASISLLWRIKIYIIRRSFDELLFTLDYSYISWGLACLSNRYSVYTVKQVTGHVIANGYITHYISLRCTQQQLIQNDHALRQWSNDVSFHFSYTINNPFSIKLPWYLRIVPWHHIRCYDDSACLIINWVQADRRINNTATIELSLISRRLIFHQFTSFAYFVDKCAS